MKPRPWITAVVVVATLSLLLGVIGMAVWWIVKSADGRFGGHSASPVTRMDRELEAKIAREQMRADAAWTIPLARVSAPSAGGEHVEPATRPVGSASAGAPAKPGARLALATVSTNPARSFVPLATIGVEKTSKLAPVSIGPTTQPASAKPVVVNIAPSSGAPSLRPAVLSAAAATNPPKHRLEIVQLGKVDALQPRNNEAKVVLPEKTATNARDLQTAKLTKADRPNLSTSDIQRKADSAGVASKLELAHLTAPASQPAAGLQMARAQNAERLKPTALESVTLKPAEKTPKIGLATANLLVDNSTARTGLQPAEIKNLLRQMPPPLEEQRESEEKNATDDAGEIRIETGFECSTPLEIEKISPTHFAVTIKTEGFRNWFMFRLVGAKGKTVRIDIKDAPLGKWATLNPVYAYCKSLDDADAFRIEESEFQKLDEKGCVKAYNGPLLPPTEKQSWHFMPNVWSEKTEGMLSFVHHFDENSAYIALKVPYTPAYNERVLDGLRQKSNVTVHVVGQSAQGRPLKVVEIGNGDRIKTPCILIYAREHANEQDTSWAVLGAIEYLTRDAADAEQLRQQFTFLLIPMLDPDGAIAGKYESITQKFVYDGAEGPEARAYAAFFRQWLKQGHRLDLVINLHNVESAEASHLSCPRFEPNPERTRLCESFHSLVVNIFEETGFTVAPKAWGKGSTDFRLGGYLSKFYGALHMPYELNSQDKTRHLNLNELRGMGEIFVKTSTRFLLGSDGGTLVSSTSHIRSQQRSRMEKYEKIFIDRSITDALQIEWVSWQYEQLAEQQTQRRASKEIN